ncbi:MAG: glycosyltransferase family 4 protein [Burkholderiaceae bacterium]
MLIVLAVVASLLTALLIRQMLKFRLVDQLTDKPNHRSLHRIPVPRIGGIAIFSVVLGLTTLWSLLPITEKSNYSDLPNMLFACVAILALLGVGDDKQGLGPLTRAVVQLLCATALCLAWAAGGWMATPLTTLGVGVFLLALVSLGWGANLFNFMDGSDGNAAAMSFAGFGAMAVLAPAESLTAVVASLTTGAAAGFLLFNWHPARVFLGDAGSVPLGFLATGLAINGSLNQYWPIWLPIAGFMPFIFDASTTLIRRLVQGHQPWQAHRQHAYQRLILGGLSHQHVALGVFVLSALGTSLIATIRYQNGYVFFLAWTVIISVHAAIYRWALRLSDSSQSEQQ